MFGLTDKTFKKGFLSGKGEVTLTGSTALATALSPEAPFPDDARALVTTKVAGSTPELKFGSGAVACTARFSAGADLRLTLLRAGTAPCCQLVPHPSPRIGLASC